MREWTPVILGSLVIFANGAMKNAFMFFVCLDIWLGLRLLCLWAQRHARR